MLVVEGAGMLLAADGCGAEDPGRLLATGDRAMPPEAEGRGNPARRAGRRMPAPNDGRKMPPHADGRGVPPPADGRMEALPMAGGRRTRRRRSP